MWTARCIILISHNNLAECGTITFASTKCAHYSMDIHRPTVSAHILTRLKLVSVACIVWNSDSSLARAHTQTHTPHKKKSPTMHGQFPIFLFLFLLRYNKMNYYSLSSLYEICLILDLVSFPWFLSIYDIAHKSFTSRRKFMHCRKFMCVKHGFIELVFVTNAHEREA